MSLVRYTPKKHQEFVDLATEKKVKSFTAIIDGEDKEAKTVTLIVTMPASTSSEPNQRVEGVPVEEIEFPK
jgi:hypothetical protein